MNNVRTHNMDWAEAYKAGLDLIAAGRIVEGELVQHGYDPNTQFVWVLPIRTEGWGPEGSILGGIPQAIRKDGTLVTVPVDRVDWEGPYGPKFRGSIPGADNVEVAHATWAHIPGYLKAT